MSRLNCGVPIYALTPDAESVGRMALYRGVYPLPDEAAAHRPRPACWPKPSNF
jgi:pyruvate kinase